jgi:ComF family protein
MYRISKIDVDYILPVPISRKRKHIRGYNQVSLWGKYFARKIGVPYSSDILKKVKETKSQVNLSLDQRKVNLKNSFKIKNKDINMKNILVIDDVITTGTTMSECGSILKTAGAKKVYGMALAKSEFSKKILNGQEEANVKKT